MSEKIKSPASLKQSANEALPKQLHEKLTRQLKMIERKSRAGQNEKDNGFYHMARVLQLLEEQFPRQEQTNQHLGNKTETSHTLNCPLHILFNNERTRELAKLLVAFHDLIDKKHFKRIFQINDEQINDDSYSTPKSRAKYIISTYEQELRQILQELNINEEDFTELLSALDIVELTAEQIRDKYSNEIKPWQIPIAELSTIATIVQAYGPLPILIKAIELIDNLKYPLPGDNKQPNIRMRQDAIEAFYFYLPFLEIIGAFKLHRRLKELALRYLYNELTTTQKDGLPQWKKEIIESIEKAAELAKRSQEAANIIIQALFNAEETPRQEPIRITPLEEFTKGVFYKTIAQDSFYGISIIPPLFFGRIKGRGSAIEKAIRYIKDNKNNISAHKVARIIPQIPDLYGVTIVANRNQLTKMITLLRNVPENLKQLADSYNHPLNTPLIEEIQSGETGYNATHVILHIPQSIIHKQNRRAWKQLVQTLGLNKEQQIALKRILRTGSIRIEIHLTTPQNNLHNLFYATHVAYVATTKRKSGDKENNTTIHNMHQIEDAIRTITYTWKP